MLGMTQLYRCGRTAPQGAGIRGKPCFLRSSLNVLAFKPIFQLWVLFSLPRDREEITSLLLLCMTVSSSSGSHTLQTAVSGFCRQFWDEHVGPRSPPAACAGMGGAFLQQLHFG